MPDGGKLEITTRSVDLGREDRMRLDPGSDGRHVCLAFRYTGSGMDEKSPERIFEPFFTTQPQELGTGLNFLHRGAQRFSCHAWYVPRM